MKLPITEKFLWDLYKLFQAGGDVAHIFSPRSIGDSLQPELRDLKRQYDKNESAWRFSQLVKYLVNNGYIKELEKWKGGDAEMLTEKGKEKVLKIKAKVEEKQKRKDGKWIMLMFDVPEHKKMQRDSLRLTLQGMGYRMLQKSVWVCPYDMYEDTLALAGAYGLKDYIRIFLIEEIEV